MTEDEMVRCEFEQTRDSEGQRSLVYCIPRG